MIIFSLKEVIGILDLWYLGNYKIQQGVLQQILTKFYNFETVENVDDQFNNLMKTLKKEKQ